MGSAQDDGSWWTFDGNGRDCLLDDTYTFTADGTYEINHDTETWLETWQTEVTSDGCGAPIAPHVNATHTYTLDGTTLTVSGEGAYIGLAKAHNTGEDGNSGGSITYEILEMTSTTMTISLYYEVGFWTFDLVKE